MSNCLVDLYSYPFSKLLIYQVRLLDHPSFQGYVFECHLKNGRVVRVDDEKVVRIMPLHAKRDFPGLNLPCAREAGKIGFDCFKLIFPSLNLQY